MRGCDMSRFAIRRDVSDENDETRMSEFGGDVEADLSD